MTINKSRFVEIGLKCPDIKYNMLTDRSVDKLVDLFINNFSIQEIKLGGKIFLKLIYRESFDKDWY